MVTRFICPDGNEIEIPKCTAEGGCRLGRRCMTRSTLILAGRARPWTGKPSTTQLCKGTYEAMLLIKNDYAESPDDMMFKLLGTNAHSTLERSAAENTIVEKQLEMDGITGRPDEIATESNWTIMTDYKTSGAYTVSKALGYYEILVETDEPVSRKTWYKDPATGKKFARERGQNKMKREFRQDISRQDCQEWRMQLNWYRLMAQVSLDIEINELQVQAVARDGGLKAAREYGLEQKCYMIPIPILPEAAVRAYFHKKRDNLLTAIDMGDWDERCSVEETWEGNKCKIQKNGRAYCSARPFCKFMGDVVT